MSYGVAIIASAVNVALVYWLYPRLGLGITLSSLVGEALRGGTNGLVLVFAIAPLAAGAALVALLAHFLTRRLAEVAAARASREA